ncbi:MAG: hypothetical protein EVA65_05740 [Oceanococcus sp.]|nr:MAG: hypothetical protein EVA65_05740 [Oceanococcus sp.]
MLRHQLVGALLAAVIGAVLLRFSGLLHWGAELHAMPARTQPAKRANVPVPGCIGWTESVSDNKSSVHSPPYQVRVPDNYVADRPWPLAVVLPPAGLSAALVERHAGLTATLTSSGFVVAFVGASGRFSMATLHRYRMLLERIALDFCVDPNRVLWLGHSNGATASLALALGTVGAVNGDGLVLSGVGWDTHAFEDKSCPKPLDVLVMHGAKDKHFPNYGRDTANWLAMCNGCAVEPWLGPAGCLNWSNCEATTRYCESSQGHWPWAGSSDQLIRWLRQREAF